MVITKRLGVVAVVVSLAALASVGCSNSLTGTDSLRRQVQSKASNDSTGGGTCLTGWIATDGHLTCPGGH